jgi:hypothetical protein
LLYNRVGAGAGAAAGAANFVQITEIKEGVSREKNIAHLRDSN